jgi:phage gpG-like protein
MDPGYSNANAIGVSKLADMVQKRPPFATVVRQIMSTAKILAVAGVHEHFANATGPDGKPWKPIHPRPDGSRVPLRDKGLLEGSVKGSVNGAELVLRASHPGARVHQFGAIIVPKTAKMLSIPLTVEAKRYGSPRRFPKRRRLFVFTSTKTGNKLLAESKDGKLTFHYVLKDSVYIPPRPYIGFSDRTLKKIERVVADRFADSVSAIFRPQSYQLKISM